MSGKTVFISYRRDSSGRPFARLLEKSLTLEGYDVFLDVDDISAGKWANQILSEVPKRDHFLILLTPGALDSCNDESDWVRREFELAVQSKRNIVPVSDESLDLARLFQDCPESMKSLFDFQVVTIGHNTFEKDVQVLVQRFIPPHKAATAKSDVNDVDTRERREDEISIDRGVLFTEVGPFHEALAANDQVTQQGKDSVGVKTGRAEALRGVGRYQEALAAYDEIIQQHPENVVAKNGRAETLRGLGRFQEALAVYDAVVRQHPENTVAKNGLAEALRALGRFQEALAVYDAVVRQHPENVVAKNGRAEALRDLGYFEEALAAYDEVVLQHPENVVAKNGRAEALRGLGRLEEALAAYNEVGGQHPKDIAATIGRAEILKSQGQAEADQIASSTQTETKHPDTETESPALAPTKAAATIAGAIFKPTFASFESDLVAFDPAALKRPLEDALGIERYASHLAQLISARETPLPLSIGLFGDWGSGKSYFMRLLHQQVDGVTENPGAAFCRKIVQIHFNAWHYLDTNLWANLVCEILDQLFGSLRDRPDTDNTKVEALKKRLGEQSALAAEAREALRAAEASRSSAEELLRASEDKRMDQERTVASFINDLTRVVVNKELRDQLDQVSNAFGLSGMKKSFDELERSVNEVRTFGGRVKAMALALFAGPNRWRQFALLAAAFATPIVFGLIVPSLLRLKSAELADIVRTTTELAGLILTIAAWVSSQVRRGSEAVNQLEDAYEKVKKAREDRRKEAQTSEEQKKLDQYVQQEADAQHALLDAEAKVREIESELKELAPGRRLFRFLEQRVAGGQYRQHLGLVSLVRRDFEQLSRLLRESSDFKDGDQPMLDRIVLYIDDLDRCRTERVIQVLEAVHLLLAFPLFAVVVAVDPRWLRRSLLDHYPKLIGEDVADGEKRIEGMQGGLASPQDYLEKIFQVPFNLQRLERSGFEQLAGRLFITPTPQLAGIQTSTPPVSDASSFGTDKDDAASTPVTAPLDLEVLARDLVRLPLPERLTLEEWEVDAVKLCHSLFRTPRAVKRFANTYCLIRVGVEPEDWDGFLGSTKQPGSHRTPLLMLAVSSAFPSVARRWLDALQDCTLKTWTPTEKQLAALEGENSSAAVISEWRELRRGLIEMHAQKFARADPSKIAFWIPKVRRYSF